MDVTSETHEDRAEAPRRWQPLSPAQRRVAGVLVEKAKTTPESYPLTLNSLTTGCNQKSNRAPKMDLDTEQVQDAVDSLRGMGAVVEVQTGGRVPKYRHLMKEWLGVERQELAVMVELLLRGPQTLGELRGRAARMEKIADVAELTPILEGLRERDLVVELTPAGRGQLVTHNLYPPDELHRVRERAGREAGAASEDHSPHSSTSPDSNEELAELRREIADLAARVERLEDLMR